MLLDEWSVILQSMIWENRQLVTNEPVEFDKLLVGGQDCGKITDHFGGIIEYTPI